MNSIVKKLLKQKHKEYKKKKEYMLSGNIEYYTFRIPIYKTPPVPDYHKHYCFHKDEIIVDLDKENKKLKNIIKEAIKYNEELLKIYDCGVEKDNAETNILILKGALEILDKGE